MKSKITALFVASAGFASAATTTVYSGSAVNLGSSNNNIAFNIAQFNTALGTLTGVTVKVTTSSLVGSFKITNQGLTDLSVGPNIADFRVDDVSNNLGYTLVSNEIDPLVTTPTTSPPASIPAGSNQTYTIALGQGYTIADQNISGSYFGVYSGNGNVTFNVRNRLNISADGSSYAVDSTSAYTTTQMAITYTYEAIPEPPTPVPEPSAVLLGGLGFLCLLRRRR